MSEYDSLAEFLRHCEPPLISVRGYEVYSVTLMDKTTYPVVDVRSADIAFTAQDLSEAVVFIINGVCLSLIEEVKING